MTLAHDFFDLAKIRSNLHELVILSGAVLQAERRISICTELAREPSMLCTPLELARLLGGLQSHFRGVRDDQTQPRS